MRLALDAMGGDVAPRAMVQGAIDFCQVRPHTTVLLVGREDDIKREIAIELKRAKLKALPANIQIHHAPEVIGMSEKLEALRERPNDSMNVASKLVKEDKADAVILCGNTACSVAAAQMHLRRVPGVLRAAILTPLPTPTGHTWVVDCGANALGKPEHLVQFAQMTSVFLQEYSKIEKPKVAVLSIGEEKGKGNVLVTETLNLIKSTTTLNLTGLCEGHHIFRGEIDVVVTDGFTGNIVLKTAEGTASMISSILKQAALSQTRTKAGAWLMKPAFENLKQRTHWSLVGGCLLVGVDGVCIIGHGRSNRVAVFHALGQAQRCLETGVMEALRKEFRDAKPRLGTSTVTKAPPEAAA